MDPVLLAALLGRVAIPELLRWLASLSAEGKVVTAEEALAKLELDVEDGQAAGEAFLASHPPQP